MACSPEQLAANRKNASHSTGPKTLEGKAASRRNGLKHGLSGQGIVLAEEEQAEVEDKVVRFRRELKPVDSLADAMVFRVAVAALRMERCVNYETATLTAKALEVLNDPTIESDTELRQALALARFDHSPESAAVRRYEAAASREFFKAYHTLRTYQPDDATPHAPAPRPAYVAPTPVARTTSTELGSSCKPNSTPITRDTTPSTRKEMSPIDELIRTSKTLIREFDRRADASNPLNFAIGKTNGSPG